jgi:hypothetical protein
MRVQRRVAEDSRDVETQLSQIFNKSIYCSLDVDEPTDITSVAQICIFVYGLTSNFEVLKNL